MPGCLNITSAQKWYAVIFLISAEKVSRHNKRNFLHLLNKSRGFATQFLQITTSKVVQKCKKLFCQAGKLFFAEIWKITACHFWADVMLRQPRIQASRVSTAQKSRGLRVVLFQKLFLGYIFCFLGDSFGRCIFEQYAHETNLKKKRSVKMSWN